MISDSVGCQLTCCEGKTALSSAFWKTLYNEQA